MKFSIILPVYNVEKYLSACIDSILNQTFKDYEIILVDDGSPDNCPQICDEYANIDSRIMVVHQKNAGIASARNAGIHLAKGEYTICIDSDDFLIDKDVLKGIASKTMTEPDVVLFGYKKYFESDNSWGVDVCPDLKEGLSVGDSVKYLLIQGSYNATAWTKAVRRDFQVTKKIHFKPGMVSGEDVDWYLNLLCYVNRIEVFSRPCVAYRQRPDSISHSPKVQSLTDFMWLLEFWPNEFVVRQLDKSLYSALMCSMGYYWANTMILFSSYDKSVTVSYKEKLKELSSLRLYAITPRAKFIRLFYNLLGLDFTIAFLKLMGKIKKRQ